jgi:hypothetical protein
MCNNNWTLGLKGIVAEALCVRCSCVAENIEVGWFIVIDKLLKI